MPPAHLVAAIVLLAPVNAVAVSGILVFAYNRTLARLHESILKKAVGLGMHPAACVAGPVLAWAVATGRFLPAAAVIIQGLLLAAFGVTMLRSAAQFRADRADALAAPPRPLPAPPSSIAWNRLSPAESLALRLWSPLNVAGGLELRTHRVRIDGLGDAFDGYRIVHLTDFHVHRTLTDDYYRHAIAQAMHLAPDLVLLGGDYVTRSRHIPRVAGLLEGLRAPDGVLAIRGNHDYWTRPGDIAGQLALAGARLCVNECVTIRREGAALEVLLLETPYFPLTPMQERRLATPAAPRIALVHSPDEFATAARLGAQVALAGHTHGGQVRLPFFGTTLAGAAAGPGLVHGSGRLGPLRTIVSNGVGAFVPLRVQCPPQIVLLVLSR